MKKPVNKVDLAEEAINYVQRTFGVKLRGTEYNPRAITAQAKYAPIKPDHPIARKLQRDGFNVVESDYSVNFIRETEINVNVVLNKTTNLMTCSIAI